MFVSDFRKKVLRVVSRIPCGQVLTYREVAVRVGSPHAYRAVGSIMANNYDSLIPCHRVVKSDGSLGNYNRGGIAEKKKKLESEGVAVVRGRVSM